MELRLARESTVLHLTMLCQQWPVNIGWDWRNCFIPYLCQLFSRPDVGQPLRNVCYCGITFIEGLW